MLRILTIVFVTLCGAYILLFFYALFTANLQIFPAPEPSYELEGEYSSIKSEDGETVAIKYLAHSNPEAPLIIYHHGNGEDLGTIGDRLELLNSLGFSVLAYDYPGYGQSTGKSNETNTHLAAQAVQTHAIENLGFSLSNMIHYGRSLGGGPAIRLAANYPVRALILEATFTSTFRVFLPIKLLPWDVFDNQRFLPKVSCPILLIHGTSDWTVPEWHSEKLSSLVPEKSQLVLIKEGGHNNLTTDFHNEYLAALRVFIKQHQLHIKD